MLQSYQDCLDYLFGRLPMFQREGQLRGKQSLTTIRYLLDGLGNPEAGITTIHVAGTNGKGSVSHGLAALARAAGLRVGLYTSPHYVDFRERIRIDGQPVAREQVLSFTNRHRALIESCQASFFEVTVAMAFYLFSAAELDLVVVEVGMGGRLDSTNVIRPLLSVITNIDLDHTDVLGNTLADIAREKAGIIKDGVPVLVGKFQAATWPVFSEVASSLAAPVYLATELVLFRRQTGGDFILTDVREKTEKCLPAEQLSYTGPFAAENLQTLLAAWKLICPQIGVAFRLVPSGLDEMHTLSGYRGRYMKLSRRPTVLADAGHNAPAWLATGAQIRQEAFRKLLIVCGFVQGKDPLDFVRAFGRDAQYFVGALQIPRNAPVSTSVAVIQSTGAAVAGFSSVAQAYEAAREQAASDDLIFVGGSTFVVGALLDYLDV